MEKSSASAVVRMTSKKVQLLLERILSKNIPILFVKQIVGCYKLIVGVGSWDEEA